MVEGNVPHEASTDITGMGVGAGLITTEWLWSNSPLGLLCSSNTTPAGGGEGVHLLEMEVLDPHVVSTDHWSGVLATSQ